MAENKETSQEYESVNDDVTGESTISNIKNGVHNGVGKKMEEKKDIPNYGNAIVTQEKNKILQTTTELQEILINILQQKLKLSDVRNKHSINALTNAVEDVQKAVNNSVKMYLDNSGDICEFREIKIYLDGLKAEQDLKVNTEKFVEECHRIFLKFEETYKRSKVDLSNFLKNLEKVLKINELPKDSKLRERVLFSIFEGKIASYNSTLAASEKNFNEFESLFQNDLKVPEQDIDKKINLLLSAFNKAEIAFGTLKLLAAELLKIDFAQV